jgi:hypothetical protein
MIKKIDLILALDHPLSIEIKRNAEALLAAETLVARLKFEQSGLYVQFHRMHWDHVKKTLSLPQRTDCLI